MATYARPAARRSYDAIYADITAASDDLARSTAKGTGAAFWQAQAEGTDRIRDLWNEIVWQAVDDKTLPKWGGFAAITTRDDYARRAREARREAARAA